MCILFLYEFLNYFINYVSVSDTPINIIICITLHLIITNIILLNSEQKDLYLYIIIYSFT